MSATQLVRNIKFLPSDLEFALQNLDEFQLETPYREGGWTVNQVVHHLADSHMNAYIRFKWALTEDNPTIKTYDEKSWAELPDVASVPYNVSITLLHALHRRWTTLLESIAEGEWESKTIYHPEQEKQITLWGLLGIYSWHGLHHVAHINKLKEQQGW
jgi:hypothetical protein